ncbi:Protein SPA1-RELATED 3, partial [Mucuna pruriens]
MIKLGEMIENQELLLELLLFTQQKKREVAEKLHHTISFLCSDIKEMTNKQISFRASTGVVSDDCSTSSFPSIAVINNDEDSSCLRTKKRVKLDLYVDDIEGCDNNMDDEQKHGENILSKCPQFLKNFKKLESAYFMTRCKSIYSSRKPILGKVNKVASREKCSKEGESPWTSPFFEGLCKYLSFSKLNVKANLKQGDLLQSSNLVCSLSFDRDAEFFATAGMNKKIKVFECDRTKNEDRDIHYPVVQMVSQSTLSSTCWNTYIKTQIASSNFEGVVQLWDVIRSQVQSEMREHDQRVWSIDFSSANPTLLASGSDDGSVKLWNINQGVSVGTIKTKANVCCVQFPLDFSHFLAFGSADHQIYYYDLRNLNVQ